MRWLVLALAGCPRPPPDPGDEIERAAVPIASTSTHAIEYRVSFPERLGHYVAVEGVFPVMGRSELTLMMPVWTPGSYLVREFARNVVDLEARTDRGAARAEKVTKNRFRVEAGGEPRVAVRYRLYAHEPTPRGNDVGADLAVLNGAATFFADLDRLGAPYHVTLDLPEDWGTKVGALREIEGRFVAQSYDALVDAPMLAGNPTVHRFEAKGVRFELVNSDEGGVWDGPRSAGDAAAIAEELVELWRIAPFDRYVILNVIGVSGGGLEHHDSALLMTDRFRTKDDEAYRDWLALVSHEIFHAWNGKRLRPVALGPFDYEREVYTKELWVVEGLTSYYDDLVLARAGLITEAQYLERLSRHIHDVERAPGREHQTLAEASFDAWIDFYRRDERTSNTSVSYYAKGALVGFLIDASIRRETHESKSLDDVLREAYGRWSGPTGYRTDELYSLFEEIGGPRTRARLVDMVETTQPLDYGLAFELYGLELEPEDDDAKAKGYLGVLHERTMVTEVVEGAPAARAGISPRDEIIGVGGYRVEDLGEAVGRHRPGDAVDILLSRRGRLMTTTATLASRPREEHRLRFEKARSAAEIRRFERLLGVR